MNLAISGMGRMGQAVAQAATDRGHAVVRRFDRENPLVSKQQLRGVDVVIDFSGPDAVMGVIRVCSGAGVALVSGTTGWDADKLDALSSGNWPVLHAPNFSMGVAMLSHALSAVLPVLRRMAECDIAIHEVHHTGKADRPSGTALALAKTVIDGLPEKDSVAPEDRPPLPGELAVTAARVGDVFGTHGITIEGPSDQILLRHEARDRSGFARGAVLSAEWLLGRPGRYTFEHVLGLVPVPTEETS